MCRLLSTHRRSDGLRSLRVSGLGSTITLRGLACLSQQWGGQVVRRLWLNRDSVVDIYFHLHDEIDVG